MMEMNTAALIPAFNEEKTIEEVVKRTKEINLLPIVINDFSGDKTSELAKKADAIVIDHKKNLGKGEAIKTGLNYLKKKHPEIKYVVLVDADLQFDPKEAPKLIEVLEKNKGDYVIGSRFLGDKSKIPIRNRLGNFVWRNIFNLLFGTKLEDTNSGFVAFRINFAKNLKVHGGYIIENSMELQAIKRGLRIREVPVSIQYKEKRDFKSGIRIVLGVLIYILVEGIKYRMGL